MIYLICAILFGSLFSIIFKLCQRFRIDTRQVILFNYVTGMLVSWIPIGIKILSGDAGLAEYSLNTAGTRLACLQGGIFVLGFTLMDISVWRSGVALTNVSARASLILPVILSWLFLSQPAPDWLSVATVILAMSLIVIPAENEKHDKAFLTNKTDKQRRVRAILMLISVFACYGVSDFLLKVLQNSVISGFGENGVDTHLDTMTGMIFTSASVISLIPCLEHRSFKKNPVGIRSIIGGTTLGISNLLCTACILRALNSMATGTFYPLYNIGIVLLTTFAGVVIFKERIKWLQAAGIAAAILAIFLFFR